MQYRAIATDLDGTLLRDDQSVSSRTRSAIEAAEAAGLLVVIATGRPPRWIPPVVEQLGERGLVVCANGATVYDPARDVLVDQHRLEAEVALALVDDLSEAYPEAIIGVEQGFEFAVDESARSDDLLRSQLLEGIRIGPIRSFLHEAVTKLIVRLPDPAPPGTAAAVQAVVGKRALVTHSTRESFLEISHPDVHKAATVERVLVESGVEASEVVAFGDMPNDLELIRWAGMGVAVANAHPVLLDAADLVTESNQEDGVAKVIERVLEGP